MSLILEIMMEMQQVVRNRERVQGVFKREVGCRIGDGVLRWD